MRALFPTIIGVTPKKVLGANYGFMVALPFSTIRPERTIPESFEPDWGLNDLYVVPLYLGWHAPRADFVAGYGFYAPTGRYEAGANDNVGLGMWSQEIQAGTTVYLDAAKKISAATTAYLELHSNKKDQDLKVGNLLTLEGGAAYNVPRIGGRLVWGTTCRRSCRMTAAPMCRGRLSKPSICTGRTGCSGIGPDVTMAVFQKGGTIGLVDARYSGNPEGTARFRAAHL